MPTIVSVSNSISIFFSFVHIHFVLRFAHPNTKCQINILDMRRECSFTTIRCALFLCGMSSMSHDWYEPDHKSRINIELVIVTLAPAKHPFLSKRIQLYERKSLTECSGEVHKRKNKHYISWMMLPLRRKPKKFLLNLFSHTSANVHIIFLPGSVSFSWKSHTEICETFASIFLFVLHTHTHIHFMPLPSTKFALLRS